MYEEGGDSMFTFNTVHTSVMHNLSSILIPELPISDLSTPFMEAHSPNHNQLSYLNILNMDHGQQFSKLPYLGMKLSH